MDYFNQALGSTSPRAWLVVCKLGLGQLSPDLDSIFLKPTTTISLAYTSMHVCKSDDLALLNCS